MLKREGPYLLPLERQGGKVVGGISLFMTETVKVTLVRRFQTKLTAEAVAGSGEHSKWIIGQGKASGSQKSHKQLEELAGRPRTPGQARCL